MDKAQPIFDSTIPHLASSPKSLLYNQRNCHMKIIKKKISTPNDSKNDQEYKSTISQKYSSSL